MVRRSMHSRLAAVPSKRFKPASTFSGKRCARPLPESQTPCARMLARLTRANGVSHRCKDSVSHTDWNRWSRHVVSHIAGRRQPFAELLAIHSGFVISNYSYLCKRISLATSPLASGRPFGRLKLGNQSQLAGTSHVGGLCPWRHRPTDEDASQGRCPSSSRCSVSSSADGC
jgi:hypothetical protein